MMRIMRNPRPTFGERSIDGDGERSLAPTYPISEEPYLTERAYPALPERHYRNSHLSHEYCPRGETACPALPSLSYRPELSPEPMDTALD